MTFIYNEVVNLSKKHEVLVLCHERKCKNKFPFEALKVLKPTPFLERIFFAFLRKLGWNKTYSISVSKQLDKVLQEFSPDLIHAHFGGAGTLIMDNIKTENIPVLVHFHGFDASALLRVKTYQKKIRHLLLKTNVYPIFVSQYMKSKFQVLKMKVDRSSILYYGTNIDRFKRTIRSQNQTFTFLQVASFREKKGQIYTIKAFAKLKAQLTHQEVRLVFVGDGEMRDACEALVKTLDLQEVVEFKGALSGEAIVEELDKAHCFVHHSITAENGNQEGIPNAIMEAMAMELPVISTYHSGIPELVEDVVNGYLVKEKNVEDYADKMKEILSWQYLPKNRLKIERQFEEEKHAQILSSIYESVLEEA